MGQRFPDAHRIIDRSRRQHPKGIRSPGKPAAQSHLKPNPNLFIHTKKRKNECIAHPPHKKKPCSRSILNPLIQGLNQQAGRRGKHRPQRQKQRQKPYTKAHNHHLLEKQLARYWYKADEAKPITIRRKQASQASQANHQSFSGKA